ncbi:MAG: DUF695 domain-containing protein [Myxococcota bacterium]|nr:DUF695 domain-containing protein [Myxococcota bacterium]
MPRTWREGFDFYMVEFEDGPASIMVDMAAALHAPVPTHPALLIVRMRMKRPQESGLRSAEEAQRLFVIEDAVIAALRPLDGTFVGRVVRAGSSDLFFYLPAEVSRDSVEPQLRLASQEYPPVLSLENDPEWTSYFEILFPDRRDQQRMVNRRLCEQLQEQGDRPGLARPIDHLALFPDEGSARAALEPLRAEGFQVDAPSPPPPHSGHQMWALGFHRSESPTHERMDEVTLQVLDLLEGTGAHYDGWSCAAVAGSA